MKSSRNDALKIRCIDNSYYKFSLIQGKIYDVIDVEDGLYRIIDEDDDDGSGVPGYLYPPALFEIMEEE